MRQRLAGCRQQLAEHEISRRKPGSVPMKEYSTHTNVQGWAGGVMRSIEYWEGGTGKLQKSRGSDISEGSGSLAWLCWDDLQL